MYDRRLDGRTLEFGHEGLLYNGSFVMYDQGTGSLWIHATGMAATGPLRGSQLEFLPCEILAWGSWLDTHPESLVLDQADPSGGGGPMGYNLTPESVGSYGLSLGQGRTAKLYPYEILMEEVLVHDEFDGKDVLVLYDSNTESARAFLTRGHTFAWIDDRLKDERGVFWNPAEGTSSRKDDEPLEQVPATTWLQQRWEGFYAEGEVYGTSQGGRPATVADAPVESERRAEVVVAIEALVGTWQMETAFGDQAIPATMILKNEGGALTGTWQSMGGEMLIEDIVLEGDRLRFIRRMGADGPKMQFEGRIRGDVIEGAYDFQGRELICMGKRE